MEKQNILEVFGSAQEIDDATTADQVVDVLKQCLERFGFDSCLITHLPLANDRRWHDQILVNGWPQAWYERYNAAGHYRFDPCVARCRNQAHPFAWSEIDYHGLDQDARRVMDEAAEFGLLEGICVPFHVPFAPPAVVTVAGASVDLAVSSHTVPALCRHALDALLNILAENHHTATPVLSDREREILQWTAGGKTAWEISCILGLSEHTVGTHLRNARYKLGGVNIVHAIVEALRRHEIQP